MIIVVMTSFMEVSAQASSNQSTNQFDDQKWRELRNEMDFKDNRKVKTEKKEEPTPSEKDADSRAMQRSEPVTLNLGPMVQVIAIIAFIVIIALILYKILGLNVIGGRGSKIKTSVLSIDDNFDEIPELSDLEKWLNSALKDKNYRLVLRIYYLSILKALDDQNMIKWRKEKTNSDYAYELADYHGHQQFVSITSIYEQVWYGEKNFHESYLTDQKSNFQSFYDSLANSHEK